MEEYAVESLFKKVNWYINMFSIIIMGLVGVLNSSYAITVIMGLVLLCLLNIIYFYDGKAISVYKYLYITMAMIWVYINPIYFVFAFPVVCCLVLGMDDNRRFIVYTCVVDSITMILILYLNDLKIIWSLIFVLISICVVFVVNVIHYSECKYINLNVNMENAMKKLAIEAMNEKSLREKIARERNLELENIRLSERDRISRDIHNHVGHTLSAAAVTLDAVEVLMDSDDVDISTTKDKVSKANERIHEAIESIRKVVRTMDSDDDTIIMSDYIDSLEELIKNFKMDTNINIISNFEQVRDDSKISIENAAFLSGAIAELLTNGVKHGKANVFVIVMIKDNNYLKVKVQDNGKGIEKEDDMRFKLSQGFGLKKIEEYLLKHGGNMKVSSNDGFDVEMEIGIEG